MSKKLLLPLLLILLIPVFLVLRNKPKTSTNVTQQQASKVDVVDEIGIKGLEFNNSAFYNIAQELGVWEKEVFEWGPGATGVLLSPPQKIQIVLTGKEQEYYKTKGVFKEGGDLITFSSIGQDYDKENDTLQIKVYLSDRLLAQSQSKENLVKILDYQAVFALYKMSANQERSIVSATQLSEEGTQERKFIYDLLEEKGPVFMIKVSLKEEVTSFIGNLTLVKPAIAQSCTGTIDCGVETSTLKCSSTGFVCWPEGAVCGEAPYIGICDWEEYCDFGDDVTIICSFRNTEALCTGPTGSCPAPYDCTDPRYQSSCTWIPGPTETPCTFGSWVDQECGDWPCDSTERLQTRWINPAACTGDWRCVSDAACDPPPSCTVSLDPSTVSVAQGTDVNYIATVSVGSGSVSQVNFSSSNTSVATVSPASDASQPYQTVGDTLVVGSSTITSDVVMDGAVRCTDTAALDVTDPGPWWQLIDSDIITNGDIISSIPSSCALPGCNPLFGLEGLGGFPGVPVYGGSTANFGEGDVSSTRWLANTQSLFSKIYDYSYFSRLVRPDVVLTEIDSNSVNGGFFASGGTPKRGYVWYHFDGNTLGDLTINSSVNMPGARKVVVLVEDADLYIEGRIDVSDGIGFIMFIVGKNDSGNKGNIYVKDDLSGQDEIEGVFLAEGQFRTGTGDEQLHIRGMVAAYDGIVLERDLLGDNADEPAEVFEFAPDFVLTFPRDLTFKRLRWKEVAP